ncbi:MAG: CHAT domain-containing protein [Cyanobacteria bacterium J06634_6]
MRSLRKKLAHTLRNISKKSKLTLIAFVSLTQAALADPFPVKIAQVIPTQGNTTTEVVVTQTGDSQAAVITGGQLSSDGSNLFHSFDTFNVETGSTASFLTTPTIQNVLSHITGGPSSIDGLLQVLGGQADLYLINPSGILFGPNIQLNLPGSLTAATASDVAFGEHWLSAVLGEQSLYGDLLGSPTAYAFSGSGPVVNLGDLTLGASEALTLMGSTVVNAGNISVPAGHITLSAVEGTQLVRIGEGTQLLSLEVLPNALNTGATSQTLGSLLTGGNTPYANQLRVNADGSVSLLSTETQLPETAGTVIVSGALSTEGLSGGEINVFGDRVALLEGTLSATGREAGGTIRFGGDYQGSLLAPMATHTYVSTGSALNADAQTQGNGGQIFVWSNELTQFYGSLSAQGGQNAGDGGFAEISGKINLDFQGSVNLDAIDGNIGTLLFDPLDIIISAGSRPSSAPPLPSTFPSLLINQSGSFTVYEDTLEALTSNVLFQADRYIEIESLSDGELTFQPNVNITFQADLNNVGDGGFLMDAMHTIRAPGGNVTISNGSANRNRGIWLGTIDTRPESMQTSNGGDIYIDTGSANITTGDLAVGDNRRITLGSPNDIEVRNITAGVSGILDIDSAGDITQIGTLATGLNSQVEINSSSGSASVGNILAGDMASVTVESAENLATGTFGLGNQTIVNLTSGQDLDIDTINAGDDVVITLGSDRNTTLAGANVGGGAITISGDNVTTGALGSNGNAVISMVGERALRIDALNTPNSSVSLTTDTLDFIGGAASVSANQLNIEPKSGTTDIYLGESGPADNLILSLSDIQALSSNIGNISIGNATTAGNIYLSAAVADTTGNGFTSPVTLLGNSDAPETTKLFGPTANTTWQISGRNSGSLEGYRNLTFSDFGNIVSRGSNATVEFNNSAAQIVESIDSGNGNLTLVGDRIHLSNIVRGNGDFVLQPSTPDTPIVLGGDNVPSTLYLSDADLAAITSNAFSSLTFGNASSGPLSLGATELNSVAPLNFRSGSIINTAAGQISTVNQSALSLLAPDGITAGYLTTDGGNISLGSENNISAMAISAQNGTNSGNITVDTDQFFVVTGYLDGDTNKPSIATGADSQISIRHGGNGTVPFTIGSASLNGTAGRITNDTVAVNNRVLFDDFIDPEGVAIQTNAPPVVPPTEATYELTTQVVSIIHGLGAGIQTSNDLSASLTNTEAKASREIFSRIEAAAGAQFEQFLSLDASAKPTQVATLEQVQETLKRTQTQLSTSPALLYVYFVPGADSPAAVNPSAAQAREFLAERHADDQLEIMLIGPSGDPIRHRQWGITRAQVESVAAELRHQSTSQFSRPQDYLTPAQQLHSWIVAPFEEDLAQFGTDNLAFIMDDGLRTVPIAVLHDGEQFLLENYSLGLMPTFSLTDLATAEFQQTEALDNRQVLAMGASRFESQPPLPAVEAELSLVADDIWVGKSFLNEAFTLENLKNQLADKQYRLLHLATHAVFESGDWDNSYIQLWDDKVTLSELSSLGLGDRDLELIILSACNTALGDRNSEYGFAGFAVNAGSQSALASLWPVSDEGTLGFMSQFYHQLSSGSLRSESLRQAQLDMLRGNVRISNGQIIGPNDEILAVVPELAESGRWDFSHPFYWSAFTMIGNPW